MVSQAPESSQIERTRRKVEKRLLEEQKKITKEAIDKAAMDIQHWLARHSNERVNLKDRTIHRDFKFSKSRALLRLMQNLQKDTLTKSPKAKSKLSGRISNKREITQKGLASTKKVKPKLK